MKNRSISSRFCERSLDLFARAQLPLGFEVKTSAAGSEILLYDEVGFFGVTAKDFVLALAEIGDGPVTVRINSPGGDVFDGLAIYNALKARKSPTVIAVDGIAASAASFIAMAGSSITMAEQSMMMIHNCQSLAIGDRNTMLEMASIMEKIDGQLADIYANKTGKPVIQIAAMMDSETWLTSSDAKTFGLCDSIFKPANVDAVATPAVRAIPDKMNFRANGFRLAAKGLICADALPPYDPDGDGDNDAQEALGYIASAAALIAQATGCLTGSDDDDDGTDDSMPIVPGAQSDMAINAEAEVAAQAERAAAAEAKAKRNLANARRLRIAEADNAI